MASQPRAGVTAARADAMTLPRNSDDIDTGPYGRNDPVPVPEATEHDSETIWRTFQVLQQTQDRAFARTEPFAKSTPGFVPAELRAVPVARATASAPDPARVAERSLEELLRECRRDNRICPAPPAWQALYAMLPGKRTGSQWDPPPPVAGQAWHMTGAIAKRVVLRAHLEWAVAHGVAPDVLAFLRGLRDDQWLHMGA